MKSIRQWIRSLRIKRNPPKINTQYGETTEWARHAAAVNMKLDPARRKAVEKLLTDEMGSEQAGVAEARRRYPEAYDA